MKDGRTTTSQQNDNNEEVKSGTQGEEESRIDLIRSRRK